MTTTKKNKTRTMPSCSRNRHPKTHFHKFMSELCGVICSRHTCLRFVCIHNCMMPMINQSNFWNLCLSSINTIKQSNMSVMYGYRKIDYLQLHMFPRWHGSSDWWLLPAFLPSRLDLPWPARPPRDPWRQPVSAPLGRREGSATFVYTSVHQLWALV